MEGDLETYAWGRTSRWLAGKFKCSRKGLRTKVYLENVYGAEIAPTADIIDRWGAATTAA